MKKLRCVLCLLLCVCFALGCFAACGKTEQPETEPTVTETEPPADDETSTEPEETAAEPVSRITAEGGTLVEAYDISFCVPDSLTANDWNGMLGVYDFYTGDYSGGGGRPTGMDINLSVTAESNTDGDLLVYARAASKRASGAEVEPEEVDLNGFTWLRFTVDAGQVNYYAVFNDGLYEIVTARGGDTQENYDAARQMLEVTLQLAIAEY